MPVVTDDQIVSLHTASGVQLFQFLPSDYTSATWKRVQRDASSLDLVVPPISGLSVLDVLTWAHWLTVWDGARIPPVVLWKGPIQQVSGNLRRGLEISAKDHAAYLMRTRVPLTKRWDVTDPATIAGELWQAMLDQHGVSTVPIIRRDLEIEGFRIDYQTKADAQMLDQTIKELADLGMRWTVVSGTPIIGPLGLEPVAVLGEDDFVGDIDIVRDGSAVFNDVIVRGPDTLARARTDYYGQQLQTIHDVDNLSGVSNVVQAAQSYIGFTGNDRTRLSMPSGTILHPEAPVSIDDLMPSARFVIEAAGIRQLMELTSVEVTRASGSVETKVTMEAVEPYIELSSDRKEPTITVAGKASR